jgi:CelD/BcsL family acetyltransferase involved in cellulose biosynthesis
MMPALQRTIADVSDIRAEVLRGGAEVIEAIGEEWSALCGRRVPDEPFYRPEWIGAYLAAFAPAARVAVIAARTAEGLVGVLPLISEVAPLGGIPARKLRSAGNAHTCRFELVCAPEVSADAVARTVLEALLAEPGWDVLELDNAPRGGAAWRLAQLASNAGCRTHAVEALSPPYLDLASCGGDRDRLLGRLDAKFRANLRRRLRKLEAHGAVALARCGDSEHALEQFYALERAGWKGGEGSAIACSAGARRFYDCIALDAARRGELRVYTLECGSRAAAMYLGLYAGGRYYLLKTAYDETVRECSPGQLLTHEALGDLLAAGCTAFDFLGGQMPWKSEWSPQARVLDDLYVFRGPAGQALHALRFRVRPALARAARIIRGAR